MKEKKGKSRLVKTLIASRYFFATHFFLMVILYPTVLIINNLINNQYNIDVVNRDGTFLKFMGDDFVSYLLSPINSINQIFQTPTLKGLFLGTTGFITALVLIRIVEIWSRLKKHVVEDASEYGAYGTATWAKETDITEDKKNFTNEIKPETFGSLIGKAPYSNEYIVRLFNSQINSHTLVVAGSGKGKTQAFALNQILFNQTRSIVAGDGKAELYRKTSKQKAKEGYKIIFIDFVKFGGNCWNPLSKMIFDEIDNFSTALVNAADDDSNNVWGGQAINYISACIAYVLENLETSKQNMTFVRKIMNLPEIDVKELFAELPEDSIARDYFGEISGATGSAWDGILITAKNATRFWKQKRIQRFTSKSDFEFTDLGTEKIAMYLRIHPTDKTFNPLVNTFFTQMLNTLIEEVEQFGESYPISMDLVLDEFTGIGLIPGFQAALAFVRQLGINIMPIVQDISQLVKIYGEEDTESIISNCDNFVFLGTNSTKTGKHITEALGETTKKIRGDSEKTTDISHSKDSQNYTAIKRDLMTRREVLKLDISEGIYFPGGKDPIKFKKAYAYELFPDLELANMNWHLEDKDEEDSKISLSKERIIEGENERDILKEFYEKEQTEEAGFETVSKEETISFDFFEDDPTEEIDVQKEQIEI